MGQFIARIVSGVLWLSVGLSPGFCSTLIEYETADLPDSVPGQDRWLYRYFVSGFSFDAGQGFTIWFDSARFTLLEPPAPPNPQWDVLVLQPDPALPDRGAFDALALASGAPVSEPFTVAFVSLGGTPGSQPFDVNQFDAAGNPTGVLESGFTVPRRVTEPVPEPAFSWPIILAGACMALRNRVVSRK